MELAVVETMAVAVQEETMEAVLEDVLMKGEEEVAEVAVVVEEMEEEAGADVEGVEATGVEVAEDAEEVEAVEVVDAAVADHSQINTTN
jgi:hypothetical protein